MSTKDIEELVKRREAIKKIEKAIDRERNKYESIIKYLDKGFDIRTGVEYHSKEIIERKKIEARENFYNFVERMQNKIVEIETGIYEEEETEEIEEPVARKPVQRKFHNYGLIGTAIATTLLVGGMAIGVTNYINHNNEVDRKTKTYAEELDEVVNKATYSRIGNAVYQNGELVEMLDEDKIADQEYTYIEYNDIASFIENSDNPDLAAFTLYKNYGRTDNPEYHKIITKTFRTLEFDGSELGSYDNFSTYLKSNGYETYNDYYNATRKELFKDGDSNLDNIKVNIKKMTK